MGSMRLDCFFRFLLITDPFLITHSWLPTFSFSFFLGCSYYVYDVDIFLFSLRF